MNFAIPTIKVSLQKKWSFLLKISSVNVTKSAGNCGLVTFADKILNGELHFLCSACFAEHSYKTHLAYLSTLLILMWPVERGNFYIRDNVGIKLLVKLLLGFSDLSEQKLGTISKIILQHWSRINFKRSPI